MVPVTEVETVEDVTAVVPDGALSGASVDSYLGEQERAAYLLTNTKSGMTVEHDARVESHEPASGRRALAVLTDVRVLFAVGGAEGGRDWVGSVPLVTVSGVDTESSLLGTDTIEVERTTGEVWTFPCKGDLAAPREYIESTRQAWLRVRRSTRVVDDRLAAASEHLTADDVDATLEVLSAAESTVADARSELRSVPGGERITDKAGLAQRRRSIRHLRRRAFTRRAADANARAQGYWDGEEYGTAADELRAARDAYYQALAHDGPRPPDRELEERLAVLEWRIEDLRRSPLASAVIALSDARMTNEALWRVDRLERALRKHRDLLGLSWGPNAGFEGNSEEIRKRIERIVSGILSTRIDLAERAISAADQFTARGEASAALSACDVADEHLDEASAIVSELAPDRTDEIDTCRAEIRAQRDRIEDGGDETTASADEPLTEAAAVGGEPAVSDRESKWAAETVQPATRSDAGDADDAAAETSQASAGDDHASTETPAGDPTTGGSDGGSDTANVAADASGGSSTEQEARTDLLPRMDATLRSFDEEEFVRFVASVWRAVGWNTTPATTSVYQYDVMANMERPVPVQALVRTVVDPEVSIDESAIDRCADDFERADVAVLITTGTVPESIREQAADRGVKLLDCDDLIDVLISEGLLDLLET